MTREELHNKAQALSKRLLQLPAFSREAIWPEAKIEIQRFFENLVLGEEYEIEASEQRGILKERRRVKNMKRRKRLA
jgi:hypothetical protein